MKILLLPRIFRFLFLLMTSMAIIGAYADSMQPLERWHWRYPLPQGSDLTGAAFGNGVYVVVGIDGSILRSTDEGLTWSGSQDKRLGDFSDIHFADGKFIALTNPNYKRVPAGVTLPPPKILA